MFLRAMLSSDVGADGSRVQQKDCRLFCGLSKVDSRTARVASKRRWVIRQEADTSPDNLPGGRGCSPQEYTYRGFDFRLSREEVVVEEG